MEKRFDLDVDMGFSLKQKCYRRRGLFFFFFVRFCLLFFFLFIENKDSYVLGK